MINSFNFIKILRNAGISFIAGVPDSVLKDFSQAAEESEGIVHVTAANEGGAVAMAIGHYLACGSPALVYMQNSGIGNALNPLISLADSDVYGIPMLLLVGWRGKPGRDDEPQHVKQGKITIELLEAAGIRTFELEKDEAASVSVFKSAFDYSVENGQPAALIAEKGLFEKYDSNRTASDNNYSASREESIGKILDYVSGDDIVVSTTGMISRELYELRKKRNESHSNDFLCVGGMGHASQVALGIALSKKGKRIFCIEGDGAFLMHSGNSAIAASSRPDGFIHIVLNNGAHDSVGGQATAALGIDMALAARAFGYAASFSASSLSEFEEALRHATASDSASFIEMRVRKGARKDLGRPPRDMHAARDLFMDGIAKAGY